MNSHGFNKGINLGGWFSQCDYSEERLNNFIHEEDVTKIASWGFDHVRLPVDYNILQVDCQHQKTLFIQTWKNFLTSSRA